MDNLKKLINEGRERKEITKEFEAYCDRKGLKNYVSCDVMYVNEEREIYYYLLWNNPYDLGVSALDSILELDLYKKYKYCDESKDVIEWIKGLSKEEYYSIASEILLKHPEIFDIDIKFNGKGYYTTALVPEDNGLMRKMCVIELGTVEEIFK